MKVLFVCSGGMSSAIVVNALKKRGGEKGYEHGSACDWNK